MTRSTEGPFLNVRDAARLLDIHENTIRNWIADGLLTDARVPGSRFIRLHRSEVERMVADRLATDIGAEMQAAQEAIERLRDTVERAEAFLSTIPPTNDDDLA